MQAPYNTVNVDNAIIVIVVITPRDTSSMVCGRPWNVGSYEIFYFYVELEGTVFTKADHFTLFIAREIQFESSHFIALSHLNTASIC
jgi:hypothetical protein